MLSIRIQVFGGKSSVLGTFWMVNFGKTPLSLEIERILRYNIERFLYAVLIDGGYYGPCKKMEIMDRLSGRRFL